MRRIRDAEDRSWDVVVGRASWGVFQALFVAVEGNEVRQADLGATAHDEAERFLGDLDEDALRELFERSRPREP